MTRKGWKLILDLDNYHKTFPEYPVAIFKAPDERYYGCFVVGNYYRREKGYYGEFPPGLLKRLFSLLPDYKKVLHVFSGTVNIDGHVSIDINIDNYPNVCADVQQLPIKDESFDLVIADPPYRKQDALEYNCKMPNNRLVLKEVARVCRKGGILIWVDIKPPIWSNENWKWSGLIQILPLDFGEFLSTEDWDCSGIIQMWCGSNRLIRSIILFERI